MLKAEEQEAIKLIDVVVDEVGEARHGRTRSN